jgi:UDP-glucuronate decarboxylase
MEHRLAVGDDQVRRGAVGVVLQERRNDIGVQESEVPSQAREVAGGPRPLVGGFAKPWRKSAQARAAVPGQRRPQCRPDAFQAGQDNVHAVDAGARHDADDVADGFGLSRDCGHVRMVTWKTGLDKRPRRAASAGYPVGSDRAPRGASIQVFPAALRQARRPRRPIGSSLRSRQSTMIKRILVTGGAGFLGSHLCDRLVAAGHDVICLDNFFTSQKSNVAHLLGKPNFELIRHDITHPIWLEVDEVYNLACPAAPGHYQYNPIKTIKTSVLGAINVLGLARRTRAKVFHASTSEVYGDPTVHPQPESYRGNVNPIGPRACYDEGKRCAETLMFDYKRQNKVDIKVVRIFNTYGPRMHPYDGRVVSNFIRQAIRGEDITIFGDGSQTRSFCYCDDLIDGFLTMMNGPADLAGPVNLGNPGEFTIRELAELVVKLSGSRSKIVKAKPLPEDDPLQRQPDITLAKSRLGWEPKIPLRDGLQRTIDWFKGINFADFRAPTPNY